MMSLCRIENPVSFGLNSSCDDVGTVWLQGLRTDYEHWLELIYRVAAGPPDKL